MFLPLYDIAPLRYLRAAHVNRAIMVVTALVFLVTWSGLTPGGVDLAALVGGSIPAVLFHHAVLPPELAWIPGPATLVTSIFLHAGWLHLVGNMLFLQVFGDNVEDAMGHLRFLVFYVLCGVAGALAHAVMNPLSEQPLIGASGAVAGVIAAYLVLHPRARVFGLLFGLVPLKVSAYWVLGLWVAVQVWHVAARDEVETAWWAHVGGFLAGLALVFVLRRKPEPAPGVTA
jgi:membrane associated rhomboid family serine protease